MFEFSDTIIGGNRGGRGGAVLLFESSLAASARGTLNPATQAGGAGFRVASNAEPSEPELTAPALSPIGIMTLCTLIGLARRRWIRTQS